MKRVFKRFLTNIAFLLLALTLICVILLGVSLLQVLFHYLSAIFNPFVGFILMMLVFVLVLGIFFTAIDEYNDRYWKS